MADPLTETPVFSPETRNAILAVLDAARLGRLEEALAQSQALLDQGVRHAKLFHIRGAARAQSGQINEAVGDLSAARDLAPDDPGVLNALGVAFFRLGRFGEAITTLDHAVEVLPAYGPAYVHRGLAQVGAGRIAQAQSSFRQALNIDPSDVEALGQLALLEAHTGNPAAALATAERALALNPDEPNAQRAAAEAEMAQGQLAAAEARLRAWLTRPGMGPGPRHHALGLLGDLMERTGRPALAFQSWAAGNRSFRDLHQAQFAPAGRPRLTSVIGDLTQAFDEASAEGWAVPTAPLDRTARRHVFLLGFMRSGTTLLEQTLATHPDVETMEEYEALSAPTVAFMNRAGDIGGLKALDADAIQGFREAYWREVRGQGLAPEGKVFIDKQPFNTLKLAIIHTLFPDALIIFAQRDPP